MRPRRVTVEQCSRINAVSLARAALKAGFTVDYGRLLIGVASSRDEAVVWDELSEGIDPAHTSTGKTANSALDCSAEDCAQRGTNRGTVVGLLVGTSL